MPHRRSCLLLAAVAVALFAVADAQTNCTGKLGGYSSVYGTKPTNAKDLDWSSLMSDAITRVTFYSNATCILGVRVRFGDKSVLAGTDAKLKNTSITLDSNEFIRRADVKAGSCLEWVRLHTNKPRNISAGNAASTAASLTTKAEKSGARLLALRATTTASASKPQLRQLQFAWGVRKCDGAGGAAACPAKKDMCDPAAGASDFNYCPFSAPWTSAKCVSGCCASTGKCASGSCAISGIGKDVPDLICYGVNNGIVIGGSNTCAGLGCRLSVPGCTTDAFGGNCVGTVVTVGGAANVSPKGLAYVGYPCLDATPSSSALTAKGDLTDGSAGIYMAKLWTICDCMQQLAAASIVQDKATGLPDLQGVLAALKPNTSTQDVLNWAATLLPSLKDSPLKGLIPTGDAAGALAALPGLLNASLPTLNWSLPGTDLGAVLNDMVGPNGEGLATVLRGVAGTASDSPLAKLADFIDAIKGGGDPMAAIQGLAAAIPQDIATPAGFADWLTTLLPSSNDGTNPLQGIADAIKNIDLPSGTGAPLADIVSKLPNASGQDNPLAPLLDLLAKVPVGNTTGSPLAGVQQLLSMLPTDGNMSAPSLQGLSDLLAHLPNSQDGSTGNPIAGLASLMSALPFKDSSGANPLAPLVSILNAIPTSVTDNADAQDPGAALSGLLTTLVSKAANGDASSAAPEGLAGLLSQLGAGLAGNPAHPDLLATLMSSLANGAGGGDGNPVTGVSAFLSHLADADPLGIKGLFNGSSADGGAGGALSGLMGALSKLAPASDVQGAPDAASGGSNPLGDFLSKLGDLLPQPGQAVSGSTSNPIADFLSNVASQSGDNPVSNFLQMLVTGDGSNPIASFLANLPKPEDMGASQSGNPLGDLLSTLAKGGNPSTDGGSGLESFIAQLDALNSGAGDPISKFLSGLANAGQGDS